MVAKTNSVLNNCRWQNGARCLSHAEKRNRQTDRNHAHQMAPCVETLGMYVRAVLSFQGFDPIFRQLLDDPSEMCYPCHEGG